MTDHFDEETMHQMARWMAWFSVEWRDETPTKTHTKQIAEDGAPEWHPDFAQYLTSDQRRLRTRRVMRKLRRSNVRAFEVCYRVLVVGEAIDDTTAWLNGRALKNQIPYPPHRPDGPHYSRKDALALLLSGLMFARQYW